jgi:citrate synthase
VASALWRAEDDGDWQPRMIPIPIPPQLRYRDRLPWATVMSGAEDPFRADVRPSAVTRAARTLVATLVAAIGGAAVGDDSDHNGVPDLVLSDGSRVADSLAGRLAAAMVEPRVDHDDLVAVTAAFNAAMVLLADHELATSTLAVRVAASTRADLYDAVLSGLGTIAGTLHSAASDVTLELLRAAAADGVEVAMGDAIRRWGHVPGFGHGAYPEGDPRAPALLELVGALGDAEHRSLVQRSVEAAAAQGLPPANIDFALAALAHATGSGPGAMPALFSIARVAGWVAHYLEELDERPLRFRARAIHTTDTP